MSNQNVSYGIPNRVLGRAGTMPLAIEFSTSLQRHRRLNQDGQLIPCEAENGRIAKCPSTQIRVQCVESHPVFREGLIAIVSSQTDMKVVAEAANAAEALAAFRHHRPDVTLMDLSLPGSNGTDALIAIRGEFTEARFIILSNSTRDGEICRALRAGAAAFVLKTISRDELLNAIRSVYAGKRHIQPELATCLAEHLADEALTNRELDVLRYIRDGYSNKQIAHQLAIAETTINFHIKNLIDKLRAQTRTHAVTIAVRRGLLQI